MSRGNIKKEDCKWSEVENFNATDSSYHCYYPRVCKTPYIHEEYNGVGALCNKNSKISEDGESSISFAKVEHNESEIGKCKSCVKIFNSLK